MKTRTLFIALLLTGCARVLGPPDPDAATTIDNRLRQPTVVTTPQAAPVMGFAYILPSGDETTRLIVRPIPSGKLPPQSIGSPSLRVDAQPTTPADVLVYRGLYIEVTDSQNRIVYLARMTDPRIVVAEDFSGKAKLPRASTGAVAGRFPFIPDGHLALFAMDESPAGPGNVVDRVYFSLPLDQPVEKNHSVAAGPPGTP